MYVEHPLILPQALAERTYQRSLAEACLSVPSLVILPTGLGKTAVALRVAAEVLQRRGGKVLFLAPTRPLVTQHAHFLRAHLIGRTVDLLTGENAPEERVAIFEHSDVIVATPQSVANDLAKGRYDLDQVGLLVFDEAHRGVGGYAYVEVSRHYRGRGLVLGLTASPGATRKRITTVCANLGIRNVEWRSEEDPDVRPYVHVTEVEWREVEVPTTAAEMAELLRRIHHVHIDKLVAMRIMKGDRPPTLPYLLALNKTIHMRMAKSRNKGYLFQALSAQAAAVKVAHALELAETQSTTALANYLEKLRREAASKNGSRAAKAIVSAPEFAQVAQLLTDAGEHPKMELVVEEVSGQLAERPISRVIVFTNYRDSCEAVVARLSQIAGARVCRLVGQASRHGDKGLCQREQVDVLDRLRRGEVNVVVATCIGEEGLDVADTDLVVFYEPVPSEIRSIQRRGRTGRTGPGKVVVLVTAGTRDEASLRTSQTKEAAMKRQLVRLKDRWSQEIEARKEKEGLGVA